MKMAVRIRDRAIRRAGELLKQIEPQQGARNDLPTSGSQPPEVSRQQAAANASKTATLPATFSQPMSTAGI